MTYPSSVTRGLQLGLESVYGTPVAAGKKLKSIMVTGGVKPVVIANKAPGFKHDTDARLAREWFDGKYVGDLSYQEVVYILASAIKGGVTPTIVGTSTQKWVFEGSPTDPDTPASFTAQMGSSVRAQQVPGVVFNGLDLTADDKQIKTSGAVLGGIVDDGATMTALPTEIASMIAVASDINLYVDTSAASLGTTQLLGASKSTVHIPPRWSQYFSQARGNLAHDAVVEDAGEFQIKLTTPANSAGMAFLTDLRASTNKQFLRWQAQGPQTETGQNYLFQFDLCGYVSDVTEFKDDQKVVAVDWTFTARHDDTWAKAYSIVVQNLLTAL